ncbi:unnamed protein product, partial [Ectocarpus sp. 8 AP-2014]
MGGEPDGCLLDAPVGLIRGQPGVVRHKVLNNRRHVLTEDDARPLPNVALWDVTKARQVEAYPPGTVLEDKERSLLEIIAVRPWFTVDTHLGTPLVSLSESNVFDGELYAGRSVQDEVKVNLGDAALRGLFSRWVDQHLRLHGDGGRGGGGALASSASRRRDTGGSAYSSGYSEEDSEGEVDLGGHGGIQRTLLQKRVGEFDGREGQDAIPNWVMACVLHGEFHTKEQDKMAFFLAPW